METTPQTETSSLELVKQEVIRAQQVELFGEDSVERENLSTILPPVSVEGPIFATLQKLEESCILRGKLTYDEVQEVVTTVLEGFQSQYPSRTVNEGQAWRIRPSDIEVLVESTASAYRGLKKLK